MSAGTALENLINTIKSSSANLESRKHRVCTAGAASETWKTAFRKNKRLKNSRNCSSTACVYNGPLRKRAEARRRGRNIKYSAAVTTGLLDALQHSALEHD